MESLTSAAALSIKHVRRKLETLPTTLTGTYDEAMRRIESQELDHRNIALKTLAWVSYAFRPLTVRELQHALAIEPDSGALDEEDIIEETNITALCAGLVIIDPGRNAVTLVHYTAKNYFESIRATRFPGFHGTITMSCATYLALSGLSLASMFVILRDFPLAFYAAEFMGDHARMHPEETLDLSVLEVIYRLLSHPEKRKPLISLLDSLDLIRSGFYHRSISSHNHENLVDSISGDTLMDKNAANKLEEMYSDYPDPKSEQALETTDMSETNLTSMDVNLKLLSPEPYDTINRMPEVTALHLAASMGLARVASLLIKDSGDIDAIDETGKTALALAMERGFEKAVEFLVNSGARVDLSAEQGQSLFLLISERDWNGVAEIISSKREVILANETCAEKLAARILLAAYRGNDEALRSCIKDISDEKPSAGLAVPPIALFVAVERQHPKIVCTLLDHGIDVNSGDSTGQTALHRATRRGDEEMIRLLLKKGGDVDSLNDDGRTPWSSNLRGRNEKILNILLAEGANPSVRGLQGVSELYIAGQNGETSIVGYMLASGTNPSIRTQFDWAPLHWAAYYGHVECVKLLISAGAELSPISDQDASPLDLALRANQATIVNILTRAGAKESRDIETPPRALVTASSEAGGSHDASSVSRLGRSESRMKIALTFDKPIQQGLQIGQFIYPTLAQLCRDHIYHISQPLDLRSRSMSIRLSDRRADMVEYPLQEDCFHAQDTLFEVASQSPDHQQLILRPGTQIRDSRYAEGSIKMIRDWTGGWKVRHYLCPHEKKGDQKAQSSEKNKDQTNGVRSGKHTLEEEESEYLFRTTPDWSKLKEEGCRWMTEEGKLLMRSGCEDVTPTLCFEHGIEKEMQDILVSCWVGKLWSEAIALLGREGEDAGRLVSNDGGMGQASI